MVSLLHLALCPGTEVVLVLPCGVADKLNDCVWSEAPLLSYLWIYEMELCILFRYYYYIFTRPLQIHHFCIHRHTHTAGATHPIYSYARTPRTPGTRTANSCPRARSHRPPSPTSRTWPSSAGPPNAGAVMYLAGNRTVCSSVPSRVLMQCAPDPRTPPTGRRCCRVCCRREPHSIGSVHRIRGLLMAPVLLS